jgi:hypothetical protein
MSTLLIKYLSQLEYFTDYLTYLTSDFINFTFNKTNPFIKKLLFIKSLL